MKSAILSPFEDITPSKKPLTAFQRNVIRVILSTRNTHFNGAPELGYIAHRLKSNRLAVYSSVRSLEARGICHTGRNGEDKGATIWAGVSVGDIPKPCLAAIHAERSNDHDC